MRSLWIVTGLFLAMMPTAAWSEESVDAILDGVLPTVAEERHDPSSIDSNYWMAEKPRDLSAPRVRYVPRKVEAPKTAGNTNPDYVPILGLPEKKEDEVAKLPPVPTDNDIKTKGGKGGGNLNLVPQTKP